MHKKKANLQEQNLPADLHYEKKQQIFFKKSWSYKKKEKKEKKVLVFQVILTDISGGVADG